ncbi:hypothetical protein BLNAU_8026 [Blattamonas nauphoetae]|uniref:Uncharacterized protein n=1 Tax=Blattamonas nauphoetae TaxID=2049346 RepID=A0ABQ9XZP5_9EUKA|nr:hypothetical protein BLNAU_8026 [Blattamonas nauphoetae]
MPPKHKLRRIRNDSQSTPPIQTDQSNISNADIMDSSHPDSVQTSEESSIDLHPNQSTNDFLTILPNDRPYVQISKQIVQYETKRRRLYLEPNSVRSHLVGGDIPLQHSITSDWRVVSQDSITNDDLEKGCVSLFEQVGSGAELSPSEVNHAIRFMEYTTKLSTDGPRYFLYSIHTAEKSYFPPKVDPSSFLKILSYPSDTLRAAAIAFFSAGYSVWMTEYSHKIAKTDFFSNLLSLLKPHEIPFNDTTLDFHRHVSKILLHSIDVIALFRRDEWEWDDESAWFGEVKKSEGFASIAQEFCPYLRHVIAHLVFFPWKRNRKMFETILQIYESESVFTHTPSSHPQLAELLDEIFTELAEFTSSLDQLDEDVIFECLFYGEQDSTHTSVWAKGFECLLAHADEGRQFTDFYIQSTATFIDRRPRVYSDYLPKDTTLTFADDGIFTIKVKDKLVSSSKHHVRSLWALLTPTQPQHATIMLAATQLIAEWINPIGKVKHFWNGWLSLFLTAVDPSHLPFTPQYHSLHAHLVDVMSNIIYSFEKCEPETKFSQPNITHSELSQCCLSFLTLSKEYLVHLSHNVFALHPQSQPAIYYLLSEVMRFDLKTPTTESFRRELKEEMISSGLVSSSPPFILTAELVCPLSDCETMAVVDRIVGLLDSSCSLDDSTILRMCVFFKRHNTRSLQLAFRNTGRTKEEYFHAFESFLSLHVESFQQAPISSLLSSRPDDHEPTLDEWDEADLETVPVIVRMKIQNKLSIDTDSENCDTLFVNFVLGSLQQARHCATRLSRTQIERLIAPSVVCLNEYFQHSSFNPNSSQWEDEFKRICSACDQPVVARAISSTGIFTRIVNHVILCKVFSWSMKTLVKPINDVKEGKVDKTTERMWRRGGFPTIREEGLEDAIEFILCREIHSKYDDSTINETRCILQYFGANCRSPVSR